MKMKLRTVSFIYLFLFINGLEIEKFLEKKGELLTSKNYVFFNSSDFSSGEKMHFILKSDSFCENSLKYVYYDNLTNNLGVNPSTPYSVSFSSEESEYNKKQIISKTKYFTINKKEKELNGLKGKYLLLYFGCAGKVNIKNEKKNIDKKIIIVIILISVIVALLIVGIILYYIFYLKRKNKK